MIHFSKDEVIEVCQDLPEIEDRTNIHILVIDQIFESKENPVHIEKIEDYCGSWKVQETIKASGGDLPGRTNLVIYRRVSAGKIETLFVKLAYSDGGGGEEFSRVRRHIEEEVENLRHINKLEQSSGNNVPTKVGHVAKIVAQATLHFDAAGAVISVPALIEKYVDGVNLEKWMELWWSDPNTPKAKPQTEILKLWSIFAFACSNIIRRIHNRGVIHGWIQPRHIILSGKWNRLRPGSLSEFKFKPNELKELLSGIHLVGFGTSAIVFDPDKGDDAKRLMKDEVFAAPELRNSGTIDGIFSYPVDLFSLGAMLLYTAVGLAYPFKHPSEEIAGTTQAQRKNKSGNRVDNAEKEKKRLEEVHSKIRNEIRAAGGGTVAEVKKNVANTLKKYGWPTEALARVIDKAMRKDQEDRYLCAEEMMQFILNLVDHAEKKKLLYHILPKGKNDEIDKILKSLLAPQSLLARKSSRLLGEFFSSRVGENCAWQGLSAFSGSPHFEVYGSRDLLLDWLCSFMSYLEPGDEYCTRTILPYWTDDNLGSTGRFLVKNKDLVMQDVKVKRIFIVAHDFAELPIDEQMALVGQRDMAEELSQTTPRKSFEVRVRRAENLSKLMQVERRHQLVAFVKRKLPKKGEQPARDDYFGFSFMSRGQRYREFDENYLRASITKLRFRHLNMKDPDDRSAVEQFDATWRGDSVPLDEYLNYGVPLEKLLAATEK